MSQTIPESKKLTRYRVTLDVMIDEKVGLNPFAWNWYNLLQLEGKEQVNDVYVEDLGDYDRWESGKWKLSWQLTRCLLFVDSLFFYYYNGHISNSFTMKRTHYYSIGSMLTDEEVHQVWEIVGNALDRNGFVDADGELSIRVYDETLKRNVKVLDKSLLWNLM